MNWHYGDYDCIFTTPINIYEKIVYSIFGISFLELQYKPYQIPKTINPEMTARRELKEIVLKNKLIFPDPEPFTTYLGSLKAKKLGTGAWLPSVWHFYDFNTQTLYKGDGSIRGNVTAIADGSLFKIANIDGSEVYYFDSVGKIIHTKSGLTGTTILTFAYDTSERLLTITEPFNKVTTFTR